MTLSFKEAEFFALGKCKSNSCEPENSYITHCINYDFGWFFGYGEYAMPEVYGSPMSQGILIHKDTYFYEVNHTEFSDDTGLKRKDYFDMSLAFEMNDQILHPSKYVIRRLLKFVRMRKLINERKLPVSITFVNKSEYNLEAACKVLKLDLCFSYNHAQTWICNDSGQKYKQNAIKCRVYEKNSLIYTEWDKIANTGLLDENWETYYNNDKFSVTVKEQP